MTISERYTRRTETPRDCKFNEAHQRRQGAFRGVDDEEAAERQGLNTKVNERNEQSSQIIL